MITLSQITIYPVKSLDGLEVKDARILSSGALQGDRRYAIADANGHIVNGKRTPLVHQIRSQWNAQTNELVLETPKGIGTFHLNNDRRELELHLSECFGFEVFVIEDTSVGFPDDLDASGPTLVSRGSLESISAWFPGMSMDEAHRRFRANLVLTGTPPFWEDQLVGHYDRPVRFRIGEVELLGVNPCQRCIVPTRESLSGAVNHGFSKRFREQREASLPAWAPRNRFDHFYRFALNTKASEDQSGKRLRLGDEVVILERV